MVSDRHTDESRSDERLAEVENALALATRQLRELEAAHALLQREAEAFQRDARRTFEDLLELTARQQETLRQTMAATAALAAIRASNTYRAAARLRAFRDGTLRLRLAAGRALRRGRPRYARVSSRIRGKPLGVNVAGYISSESGMGEAARASIRALEVARIPVALNDLPSGQRTHDTIYRNFTAENPHPFNLIHLNADNMEWFRRRQGRRYFRDRYSIGYWFWELSNFRHDWYPGFGVVQEVWVASRFTQAAVQQVAPIPVIYMPPGIAAPDALDRGRTHFGIPVDRFVFLFIFDVSSQLERKNPLAVIRAFRRAEIADRALLVLKFTNAFFDPPGVRRLCEEAAGLPILMFDGFMERGEVAALLKNSDCYVSLHRSEGFGLTIAEAMALGKPVIATRYSANMDFMTGGNSFPVDYRLTTLTRDFGPYLRGFQWAEPDLDHAARLMREVVEHPERAAAIGQRARHTIAAFSLEHAAARMRQRLERLHGARVAPSESSISSVPVMEP